jgi:UDP-N-acetylmuramoyl-L-alanyl-D-glutamate--2,6-diaminopimelate ligase
VVTAQTRPERPPHVPFATLVEWVTELAGREVRSAPSGPEVTGITLSSQRTQPGDLYVALPGTHSHGIDFAARAREAGAVAVLSDQAGRERAGDLVDITVENPRVFLGRLAARVYGEPATSMRMIGVTGTQGKTTTTRLAEGGLQRAGVRAGVIGTVGTRIAGGEVKTALTTPEAPDLHALFAVMRERDVAACAMEVSSHALVMGRVDGVVFDVAVFLNLGRDHLDFHADQEDYYRTKASLFTPERARLALVCIDDEHGRRLAGETTLPVRTFSAEGRDADWTVADLTAGPQGTTFRVRGPAVDAWGGVPLPGGFNVTNALAAVAASGEAGLDAEAVAQAIATGGGVPGRLERIEAGQPFTVVVDYAHKPDAVRAALESLRPLTDGRLLVVLGAGGDRDPGKRPLMGGLAARLGDVVVVTDDNPRTEDPADIRAAVLEGARGGTAEVIEEGDRRAAIATALRLAGPGDIVVVAGKGHETGQEVDGVVYPFDDRDVVRELLAADYHGGI